MKRYTLSVIVVVFLIVAFGWLTFTHPTQSAEAQTILNHGRFQLFEGNYTINAKGTPFEEKGVFKIDSQTGTTWLYKAGQTKEGTLYSRWDKVSD